MPRQIRSLWALLSGLALGPLRLPASRRPPTLTLPLKGGGHCRFASVVYASPLEGEVGAQRREGGWRGAPKGLCPSDRSCLAVSPKAKPDSSGLWAILPVLALGLAALPAAAESDEPVTVFAAASLTSAFVELSEAYKTGGGGSLRPVHAASSALAKQILHGAPADLYISANPQWMDHLQGKEAIEPDSRVDLLGNRLVLVAPEDHPMDLKIEPGFPLAAALGERRLAMGDPTHVPAGIYGRSALESLGIWSEISPKAAFAAHVRAVLALVESGAAGAGIVYASDAAASQRARQVGVFPAESHPPIRYPMAIVAGRDRPAVQRLASYLRGAEAARVFARHGFEPLIAAP